MKSLRIAAVGLAALAAACSVQPNNPFDPESPEELQAPAELEGTVVLSDPFGPEVRADALARIRVKLLDQAGQPVQEEGEDLVRELIDVDGGDEVRGQGRFFIGGQRPGLYSLVIEGAPSSFEPPVLPTVNLAPGAEVDLGELVFTFVDGGENVGPGIISGEVISEGSALGQVTVSLHQQGVAAVRQVITDGNFEFRQLPLGTFAVVAEAEGHTSVFRLDVEVQDTDEARVVRFEGEDALVAHPITAALLPVQGETVRIDEGLTFANGTELPVAVLPFTTDPSGDLGVSGMRLATNPEFLDASGDPLPFIALAASTTVPLPAADGPARVFAQFEARSAATGFAFVTPSLSIAVTKDTAPPVIVDAVGVGLAPDGAGGFLSADRRIPLQLDINDVTTAVDAVGLAFGATPEVLDDITAGPGLQRVQRAIDADADGAQTIFVVAEDRAGNRSDPLEIPVLIDTVAPDIALLVQGADDGFLRDRVAQLEVSSNIADDVVGIAVGLEGDVDETELAPPGVIPVSVPASVQHGAAVTFEAVAIDAVGNRTAVTSTVTLDLRGAVAGTLVSDAAPVIIPSVDGAVATLSDASGTVVDTQTLDGTGAINFAAVPEGLGYRLRVALDGHGDAVVGPLAVTNGGTVDLGDVNISLSRGELQGRALRADVAADNTAHVGISVSLTLVSPFGRTFSDTDTTNSAGSFVFRGVPRTLPGETLAVTADVADYGRATADTVLVGALVNVGDLLLPRIRGDFDVCRTSDPSCTPNTFFSADTVDISLRDATDVANLIISLDGEAPTTVPIGAGNRTTVSLAGRDEGEITVAVQTEKNDGTRSEVLSTNIIRDTTPPAAVTLERRANAVARDGRFTNASFVDVVVTADAGAGAVAPLANARVVQQDTAPAAPPTAGFLSCPHEQNCRVNLPNEERLLRVFAFSCDAAGNCAAPEETFVIRDITPPSLANGAEFSIQADGSVLENGVVVLPTAFYQGLINTGRATTAGGADLLDEGGGLVADVFAFRFSLSSTGLPLATLQSFSDPALPDEVRSGEDIVVPALPVGDAERTIFAQFADAAGNLSDVQTVRVIVDDDGPVAIVVLNGGLPTASLQVPFTLQVPNGAEAPRRLEMSVDDGAAQVFTVPLDGTELLTLPATEGTRRVVVNAFDRVDNVTRTELTIVLDQSGPRVDAARCVSVDCVDDGFGELVSRAADARADFVLTTVDAFTSVDRVEITFVPALPAPDDVQVFALGAGGAVNGVLLPANTSSTMSIVPIDVVGNRGATFVRAARHDVDGPVIATFTLENGAASTNQAQVSVQTDVPAGDAVEMRLSPNTSFSGPFVPFRADDFFVFAGADGDREVCVQVRDVPGNTSEACDTIELDRAPPVGTVTPVASLTNAAAVDVDLTMSDDTAQVAASTAGLSCDPDTTPYVAATPPAQTLSVSLAGGDGPRTITACFLDAAGNISSQTATVTVDRTPPTVSIALNGGAAFATTTTPTAAVTASADADALALAVDVALDCATASYGAFTTSPAVNLPSAEGPHTVRVCVRDAAGNVSSAPGEDTITLDTTPPTATVTLDGGSGFTRDASVAVSLAASSDTVGMAIANAAALDCNTATYATFLPNSVHQLTAGDGLKNVSVCLQDAAGLVSAASIPASITLDTTAPTGTVVIAGGAATTAIATVNVELNGVSGDVSQVFVTASPIACDTAPFEPFAGTSFSVTLSLPNTDNVVTACLKDGAGNVGAISDSIFFENNAGDALIIAVEGGAAQTRDADVIVSLFRPSTDFDQMKVQEAPNLDCDILTGYEAFNGTKAITLSGGAAPAEGQRTVSACVRSTSSGLTRAATDSIILDTFAPAGSVTINGGPVVANATVSATLTNDFAGAGEVVTVALSESSTVGAGGDCTGSFEAFAASRTFTFTGADGDKTLFACLRDGAGNTVEVSDTVTLDTTPPTPVSLSVPTLTNTTTINVGLTFPADAVEVALAEGALDCATTQAYQPVPGGASPSLPLTLSAGDGPRTVSGCFRDAAGNTSQATATTNLDQTSPAGTVVINGGAVFTTTQTVSVAITGAADAVNMARVESAAPVDCAVQSYVAFVSPLDFTLTAGDGDKTVQVCLEDAAGNRALALADSIFLDATAPNGDLVINDDDAATANRNVTLTVDTQGNTDVTAFAVAEGTIACNAANLVYQPLATLAPFLLSSGDGTKTVLLCLRDAAGNVSTVAGSDTIDLDTAAPVGAALAIDDGDGFLVGETTVDLDLSWTNADDVASVKTGEGAVDCQSPSGYQAVAPGSTSTTVAGFSISAGDGTKLVLACFRDAAGNIATAQDTTLRDATAPQVTSLVCTDCVADGGSVFSTDPSVVLAVTSDESGSGLASALVSVDGGAEVPATLNNGTLTVNALVDGARSIAVRLVDNAGNTSAAARTLVVTVDQQAPTLAQLLLNGSDALGNATNNRTVNVTLVGASPDAVEMAIADVAGNGPAIASCAAASYSPLVTELVRTLSAVDGTKAVSACLRDRAGNTSASAVTTTIVVDTVPVSLPATPVSIVDGDGFLNGETSVDVALSWTTAGDARRAKVQEGSVDCFGAAGYVDLPTNTNATTISAVPISAGDGIKNIGVCFQDAAGNTITAGDSTTRDNTAPTVTSLSCDSCTVDGGTRFSTSTSVTLVATSDETLSGIANASVALNGGGATTLPVNAGVINVGGLSPGSNTVLVKLRDGAGNLSTDAQDRELTIVVDVDEPDLGAGAVLINGQNAGGATNDSVVTVSLTGVPADASAMSIRETGVAPNCAVESYVPLQVVSSFDLSGGQGLKTLFVCLRDQAGNTSTSPQIASITFDDLPPSIGANAVVIQDGGDGFLDAVGSADVQLNWNTVGDVVAYKLGENAVDCASEPYTRPAGIGSVNTITESAFPLSSADGTKLVVACFKDAAGNVSSAQDTSVLDTGAPSAVFTLDGGAAFSTDATVTADFSSVSTDVVEMLISTTPVADCDTTGYAAFVNGTSVNLGSEGPNTVFACVRDGAGNVSDADPNTAGDQPYTATINRDTTNPTLADFIVVATSGPAPDPTFVPDISTRVRFVSGDVSSDVVAFAIGNGGLDCGTASYETLPQPIPAEVIRNHELSSGADGLRTVTVCVKDGAGRTGSRSENVTLDTTAPTLSVFSINNGDAVTASLSNTVSMTSAIVNDDLRAVFAADPAFNCELANFTGGFAPLPATAPALVSPGEGTKFVVGCFQDRAGNVGTAADDIVLDTTAPRVIGASCDDCLVAGTQRFTNLDSIFLTVSADVDAVSAVTMLTEDDVGEPGENRACNVDTDCRVAVGETCALFPTGPTPELRCVQEHPDLDNVLIALGTEANPVTAPPATPSQGLQTAFLAVIDAAGNLGPPVLRRIVRDTVDPQIAFALNTGTITNQQTVFVRDLAVTGETFVSGSGRMGTFQASSLSTFADAPVLDYTDVVAPFILTDAIPVTLSAGDGNKDVFVKFTDNAGNVATGIIVQRSVELDTTPPTAPIFANETETVGSGGLTIDPLVVQSSDANLVSPRPYTLVGLENTTGISGAGVSCVTAPPVCTWNGTSSFTIPSSALREGENRLRVFASDTAGNQSDPDFLTVTRDTVRPTISELIVEAGNGDILVQWDSNDADVLDFEIFYGPISSNDPTDYTGANADQGASPISVGLARSIRLTGLPNGVPVFVGARAIDDVGPGAFRRELNAVIPNEVPLIAAGAIDFPGNQVRGVAVDNGLAWVILGCDAATSCDGSGLVSVDISDPDTPVIVSELRASGATNAGLNARALDIEILGGFAYVSDGPRIRVFDISDATSPTLVQTAGVPNNHAGEDLVVGLEVRPSTGHVLAAVESEGLVIYTINGSGAGTLTQLSTYNPACPGTDCIFRNEGRAGAIAVQGEYAYVSNVTFPGERQVEVVDISNAAAPARAGTSEIAGTIPTWDVAFHGNHLYMAQNGRTRIHDIPGDLNGGDLTFTDAIAQATGQPIDLMVEGPYMYVRESTVIRVFSTEDRPSGAPEMPEVGTIAAAGGTRLSVCDVGAGVFAVRRAFCNPERQVAQTAGMALAGNVLLDASDERLSLFRVGRPVRASEVAHVAGFTGGSSGNGSSGQGMSTWGRYLIESGAEGVALVRVDTPEAPAAVGTPSVFAFQHHVIARVEDTIFVGRRGELLVLRINAGTGGGGTDYALATDVGQFELELLDTIPYSDAAQNAGAIAVVYPYVYLLTSTDGSGVPRTGTNPKIQIVDVQAGSGVGTALSVPIGGGFRDGNMVVHRDHLFVTRSTGPNVTVVDISSREAPTLAGTITASNASGVAVQGTQLFVGGSSGTRIFDLSSSLISPTLLGTGSAVRGAVLGVTGDLLISLDDPRPFIVDVSDPSDLRILATLGDVEIVEQSLHIVGKHVFYKDRTEIGIIELQ